MKSKVEQLVEQIESMVESELVRLNNTYCQETNSEDEVWDNDEEFFDVFFSGQSAHAVLQRAHFGDYRWNDDYVKFNGYGNLESFQSFGVSDLCEGPTVIAEYALENEREFSDVLDFDALEEEEEDESED